MTTIGIVLGSTRPSRRVEAVGKWVHAVGEKQQNASYTLLDLADFTLPHLDEDSPAIHGHYTRQHTRNWATSVAACDGFVFVAPEYNHSMSGVLKNAIDFLFAEWNNKAAGFVTYGIQGGHRAAEHLRLVLAELKVATVRQQVALSLVTDFKVTSRTDRGMFAPAPHQETTLAGTLGEVVAWADALAPLRAAGPAIQL